MVPQFYRNHRIFGNDGFSSENFRTFAVGKEKGLKFYRKIFELAPPPYSTGATTPLI